MKDDTLKTIDATSSVVGSELPTDEIRERIRGEWQDARRQASQVKGWTVEEVVIDLVTMHRRECAAAQYQSLMLEVGRLALDLASVRNELIIAKKEIGELRIREKQLRRGVSDA